LAISFTSSASPGVNRATHSHTDDHAEALSTLKIARELGIWFHRTFADKKFSGGPFVPPPDPAAATKALQEELDRLRQALDQTRSDAERARLAAETEARERMGAQERARIDREERAVWELDRLSNIVKAFNEQFGNVEWKDVDKIRKVIAEEIPPKVAADKAYQNAMKNADKQNARIEHDKALQRVLLALLSDHTELFKQFQDNPNFKKWLADTVFAATYSESAQSQRP
jgi:type I restriction enzyme, R subunit